MMAVAAADRWSVLPTTPGTTTMLAPRPKLRKMFVGTISIPSSAITTVRPENSTARIAVSPAMPIASVIVRPSRRSSRKRSTMKSA